MIGIYKITSPSKKVYIGQSVDIEKRFIQYKRLQCKGQIKLYSSFKKYGVEKHKFEILLECEIEVLNEFERYYQDLYCATNRNGLNLKLTKSFDRKCEHSQDTKNKISFGNKKANAIKKGIYFEGMIFKESKKINPRKIIYIEQLDERFKSLRELYNKYYYMFISYGSLQRNYKKGFNIFTPKYILENCLNDFDVEKRKRVIEYINSGAKPKGNILYQRRFRPELVKKMDEYLTKLKEEYGHTRTNN